jgi:hypothetical protein
MAKSFNISAVFTAVNKLTAPVQAMTKQISQFAQVVKSSSQSTKSSFAGVGTAAQSTASKISSSFNNINFNKLKFQVKNLQGHIKDLGQTATTIGAAGMGAGYAVYKGLDPLREKQSVVTRFGTLYGQGKSSEERKQLGEAEFAKTQQMATQLPGAVQDFAEARAMTKNFGLEGSLELMKGFTNISSAIGEKFDGEFVRALQSGAGGNDVDLFKKFGLKAGSDNGKTKLTDVKTGEAKTFASPADVLKYISQLGNKKYAGSTEEFMKTISGKESNVGDALSGASINFAEQTGLAQLYAEKLDLITEKLPKLAAQVTEALKPFIQFANNNKALTNGLLITIPALLGIGVAVQVLGFAFGGLVSLFAATKAAMLFMVGPIGLTIAAIAALAGAAYLIYKNWEPIKTYFLNVWGDIKSGFSMFGEWFIAKFSEIVMAITNWVTKWIDIGTQLVTNIQTGIANKWDAFKSWLLEKFAGLLASIPGIGGSLSASITGASGATSNLATPSSALSKPNTIASSVPVVNISNNINTNVANGTASTVATNSATGAKPTIKTNTGDSRRTSK